MADHRERNDEKDGYGVSSTQGGAPRLGGFGDDQGTRVGRPSESEREEARPGSQPVKEGLEGAILEDDEEDKP